MTTSEPSSEDLISLCKDGNREQLLQKLLEPATIQNVLSEENILLYPNLDMPTRENVLNLQRMLAAAAKAGYADIVELLLNFGRQHGVAVPHLVAPRVIEAALNENSLEVMLKLHAVDPNVFLHQTPLLGSIIGQTWSGGPRYEPVPRRKHLPLLRYLLENGYKDTAKTDLWDTHPLGIASALACCEVVELLLQYGARIKGSGAMETAAKLGRTDVLEILQRHEG